MGFKLPFALGREGCPVFILKTLENIYMEIRMSLVFVPSYASHDSYVSHGFSCFLRFYGFMV